MTERVTRINHCATPGITLKRKESASLSLNNLVKNVIECMSANIARRSIQETGQSIRSASVRGSRMMSNEGVAVGAQGIVSHHGHLIHGY